VQPVGSVVSSHAATVGGSSLTPGRTLFAGDLITTGPGGSAQIAVSGGGVLRVTERSQARLVREAGRTRLEVLAGSAWFCLSDKPLEGGMADAVVRSLDGREAVATLTMKGTDQGVIAAEKGQLIVTTGREGKSVTLREGQCVEVTLRSVKPVGGEAAEAGWSGTRIAILGAVMATAMSVIALQVNEGGLTDQEKENAVSPFRFP